MRIICVTNTNNGVGLQRDGEIVRDLLVGAGHQVELCHFKAAPPRGERADIAIFFEILAPQYFGCAEKHFFIANPEWFHFGWKTLLNHVDLVLCKTRQTQRVFEALRCECVFTGFMSRDMLDSTVKRERRFIHVAGKSQTKNTKAVLCAWTQSMPAAAQLTLVSRDFAGFARGIAGVTTYERVSDAELRTLMNSHQFHLCPSAAEGWGHYLREALSVGAVVVTTDGEPMNEIPRDAALFVTPSHSTTMSLVPYWHVPPREIRRAVLDCLNLSEDETRILSLNARHQYEHEIDFFHEALTALLTLGSFIANSKETLEQTVNESRRVHHPLL